MSAVARLGTVLSAEEAAWIAGELRQRRLAHLAAKRAYPHHRTEVKALLSRLLTEQGDVALAAAVLDGIASVPRPDPLEAVWTCPSVPGGEGRTTLAVAELINEAHATVYAATYSASWGSAYVTALANAFERGVRVTVIVDRKMQNDTSDLLVQQLPDARLWTYALTDESTYPPRQHAKLVVVDETAAFVTSANFSDAAAKRNLECGLLSRDSGVARGIKTQLEALHEYGVLVDYS
jgi:phosphatidylserine/phosphatidylglycerophosphate/cardiolipin synthase-like enzyme